MIRRVLLTVTVLSLIIVAYIIVRPAIEPLIALPQVPGTTMVFTLTLWLFSICHATYTLGWRQALAFFVLSAVISWLFEQVGVATGLVYGPYHYTDVLGPKLGHVPLLIPIAWFMMIYPSHVIANLIGTGKPAGVGGSLIRMAWLSTLGAMTMTAWDVLMDPGMSNPPLQSWVWEQGGPYFGVPLQNFVGWLLTTFTVYLAYRLVERRMGVQPVAPATMMISSLPLVAYFLVLLNYLLLGGGYESEAIRVIGLFVMGFPLLAATGRLVDNSRLS
ncbi:MAG: carotenoid biosynthesis protein [Anaerolineae bacterium]|nr:carotenoid biosynthesis protein [Anaerolineae bacterium]